MRQLLRLMVIFTCMCGMLSCVDHRESFTDVYYIHNDLDKPVSFDFNMSVYWDTCSTYNAHSNDRVWFEKEGLEISAHQTIRLHPIARTNVQPSSHEVDITPIIGRRTALIVDADTIVWMSDIRKEPPAMFAIMFTDDSIFSIYNTTCWQTVQDTTMPNTYYNTFHIRKEDLERRTAL